MQKNQWYGTLRAEVQLAYSDRFLFLIVFLLNDKDLELLNDYLLN